MAEPNLGRIKSLEGKWVGTGGGWNIIAVPVSGDPDFKLIIQEYSETITIKLGAKGPAPNKGGAVGQQDNFALEYELAVTKQDTQDRLHIENGMWLHLVGPPGTTNPNPIVRQAIVPHGNSVLMMGPDIPQKDGKPKIDTLDPKPFTIGEASNRIDFPQYQDAMKNFSDVFGPKFDPSKTLNDVLAKQDVTSTLTFFVSTANNGGIVNIPFINAHAKATSWDTAVWIETLANGKRQMQYTQTILLEFSGLAWPHIDVNTLTEI